MNINTGRIKELLGIYTKLDEEYQQELLAEAYKLAYKTTSKKQIREEKRIAGKAPLTEFEIQEEEKEIEEKAHTNIIRTGKMLDLIDSTDDTGKAALFMILNRTKGNADNVKEEEISVQVIEKSTPMKEYIEKSLPLADYNKAKVMADKAFLKEKQ